LTIFNFVSPSLLTGGVGNRDNQQACAPFVRKPWLRSRQTTFPILSERSRRAQTQTLAQMMMVCLSPKNKLTSSTNIIFFTDFIEGKDLLFYDDSLFLSYLLET
jgi:hypothetical protein